MSSALNVLLISSMAAVGVLLNVAAQMVYAYCFGTSRELDAFFVSVSIPTYALTVVTASVNGAFVPHYLRARSERGAADAEGFTRSVLMGTAGVALVVTVAGVLVRQSVVDLFFPAIAPAERVLAAHLSLYTWPLVFFGAVTSVLASHMQANARYALPTVVPLGGMLVSLVTVLVGVRLIGIDSVGLGGLLGAGLQPLVLAPFALSRLTGPWRLSVTGIGRWCRAVGVLVSGNTIVRLAPVIERIAASALPGGAISQLNYSNRVAAALAGIVSSGIGITGFTSLSAHASANSNTAFRAELRQLLRIVTLVSVPLAAVLLVESTWLIHGLFRRGRFSQQDVDMVSLLLRLYVAFFVASNLGTIVGRGLYALGRTTLATALDVLGVVFYAVLVLALGRRAGVAGIAASYSIYFCVFVAISAFFLARAVGYVEWLADLRFLGVVIVATVAMQPVFLLPHGRWPLLVEPLKVAAALTVFGLVVSRLGVTEIGTLIRAVITHLRRNQLRR